MATNRYHREGRKPVVHELKCWENYFCQMWLGRKLFEARLNDRDFQVGDALTLVEFTPDEQRFSGRWLRVAVTSILASSEDRSHPGYALRRGYVVMSVKEIDRGPT